MFLPSHIFFVVLLSFPCICLQVANICFKKIFLVSFANCLKWSSSWNLCYLELWSGTIQVQSGRSYSIGAHCDQNNNRSLNISFNLILFQPSFRLKTITIATFHLFIQPRFVKCHAFRLQDAFLDIIGSFDEIV